MSDDQIRLFIRAAALMSFRKAADVSFVSVSSVSRQMSELEKEMGVKLFERNPSGVSLTEAGKVFLVKGKEIFDASRSLKTELRAMNDLPPVSAAYLSVAVYPQSVYYQRLFEYVHLAPSLSIKKIFSIYAPQRGRLVQDVMDGWADIGAARDYDLLGLDDLIDSIYFDTDRFVLAVGPSHPWFSRKSVDASEIIGNLRFADFALPPALVCRRREPLSDLESLLSIGRMTILGNPDLTELYIACAEKGLLMLLPSVVSPPRCFSLRLLPIKGCYLNFEIRLFWLRNNDKPDIRLLADGISRGTFSALEK